MTILFWILIIACSLGGMFVSRRLQSKFQEYSNTPLHMTGKEVAEKMLKDNGIYDVQIISTAGQLTDHYNPADKTVNLSEVVYNQSNVAAAAVAAHECGHAIQHARSYSMLQLRSALVPMVGFSSKISSMILFAGVMLYFFMHIKWLLMIGVTFFAVTTLFTFVTLPVEFDASKRAMEWLKGARIVNTEQETQAKDALKWAAMTYIVAAMASLANLLYYASFLMGGDD